MRKVHLRLRRRWGIWLTACGVTSRFHTSCPADVTCMGCKRTQHMADVELRLVWEKTRKHNRFPRGNEGSNE